LSEIEKEDLVN